MTLVGAKTRCRLTNCRCKVQYDIISSSCSRYAKRCCCDHPKESAQLLGPLLQGMTKKLFWNTPLKFLTKFLIECFCRLAILISKSVSLFAVMIDSRRPRRLQIWWTSSKNEKVILLIHSEKNQCCNLKNLCHFLPKSVSVYIFDSLLFGSGFGGLLP